MPIRLAVGNKVAGDDFFDRVELMDRIWQRLPQQSIELVAPRRFGKTSIMQRLVDQPRHGCRVSFVDCEAIYEPNGFVSALANVLLAEDAPAKARFLADKAVNAISEFTGRFRRLDLGPGKVGIDLADSRKLSWSTSVHRLLDSVQRQGVPSVVILDEFSMMFDNFVRAKVDPAIIINLLTWFRSLRQEQDSIPILAFVVGGSMSLEYWLRRLNASATMNDLHREEVPPFDDTTARSFISALFDSENLKPESDVPDTILHYVQPPVPFWIQVLVWALARGPRTDRSITAQDAHNAYHDGLIGNAGRQYFQPFEERLRREDAVAARGAQRVLSQLAAAPAERGLTRSTLDSVFALATGGECDTEFDAIFADLRSDFYVRWDRDTDRCFFANSVLRDWWLRWHPGATLSCYGGEN